MIKGFNLKALKDLSNEDYAAYVKLELGYDIYVVIESFCKNYGKPLTTTIISNELFAGRAGISYFIDKDLDRFSRYLTQQTVSNVKHRNYLALVLSVAKSLSKKKGGLIHICSLIDELVITPYYMCQCFKGAAFREKIIGVYVTESSYLALKEGCKRNFAKKTNIHNPNQDSVKSLRKNKHVNSRQIKSLERFASTPKVRQKIKELKLAVNNS